MHTTPISSALDRVIEVSLGGLTGLFVSFVLLPSSAFQHSRELAAQTIERMAKAVPELIKGFKDGLVETAAHRIQDGIGTQINELSSIIAEAEHERPLRLSGDPLTGPLYRTLLRLRHDLVIIGRAARWPLPASLETPLEQHLTGVGKEIQAHLRACAAALLAKKAPPPRAPLDDAFHRYTAAIETLREEGRLRGLPVDAVERLFAAGFALEQMHRNLGDLDRCVGEWAARREK